MPAFVRSAPKSASEKFQTQKKPLYRAVFSGASEGTRTQRNKLLLCIKCAKKCMVKAFFMFIEFGKCTKKSVSKTILREPSQKKKSRNFPTLFCISGHPLPNRTSLGLHVQLKLGAAASPLILQYLCQTLAFCYMPFLLHVPTVLAIHL